MFKFKKKQPEPESEVEVVETNTPETFVSQPIDDITQDYIHGSNYQQLAEKYDLLVEQVAEIIGA